MTKKSKPIIELKDVWKTYTMGDQHVHALRGLSLQVRKGEFLAVMGASGSGKSTALNHIGALDIPTKGRVYLDGIDISTLRESELAQIRAKKIGFIFQQFNLIPTLTAHENVTLPLTFQDLPVEERNKRADELLDMVGLGERKHHRPNELSGGQQQRVAIARALATQPEVILADEPTGNLDTKTGDTVMDFLKKLHKDEKRTIIMVTHDEETAQHADRVEVLRDGTLQENNK